VLPRLDQRTRLIINTCDDARRPGARAMILDSDLAPTSEARRWLARILLRLGRFAFALVIKNSLLSRSYPPIPWSYFPCPHTKALPMPLEASRTLRVLIVSDVRVVQEGLQSVLARRDEVDVVSTADTLHATEQSTRLHPDVVLFDAARHDSVEFLKDLVASAPNSRVVAFGVKETDEEIFALAAAGTAGYVCNSAESSDVVRVLEQVMCDELPCSPRAAASLYRRVAALSRSDTDPVGNGQGNASSHGNASASDGAGNGSGSGHGNRNGHRNGDGHARGAPLSRRELQIAHLVDRGLTNKQIGRELGIEAATVKNHVHNMCEKLAVHRRGEAAARIRAISRAQLSASAPDADPALEAR